MASSNDGCGCGLLLALFGLGLFLAYWPLFLAAALLVISVLALAGLAGAWGNSRQRLRLQGVADAAQRRFAGDICRLGERHALLEAIVPEPFGAPASTGPPRLTLQLQILEEQSPEGGDLQQLEVRQERRGLPIPPAEMGALASMSAFARFLERQGIVMVNDLAVEAKATRAALQCARERHWAQTSQQTLQQLITSTRSTLAKARGNELLEPSIPQLQQALRAFEEERSKLQQHAQQSDAMLRKLHDFLSVPDSIRPILNFDLDSLFDPSRLKDLEASFEEVVQLNEAYHALSRDRII